MARKNNLKKKGKSRSLFANKKIHLLVTLALLLISYIFIIASDIGILGHVISGTYYKLFGISCLFIIPVIMMHLLLELWGKFEKRTWVFSLIYADLCVLFSYLDTFRHADESWNTAIQKSLLLAQTKQGYGIINTSISRLLSILIGKTGILILLIFINIILFFFVADVAPKDAARQFYLFLRHIVYWLREKKETFSKKCQNQRVEKNKNAQTVTPVSEKTMDRENLVDISTDSQPPIIVNDYKKNTEISKQLSMADWNIQYPDEEYYNQPPLELLKDIEKKSGGNEKEFMQKAKLIEETLRHFNIGAKVVQIDKGPTVTCYELQPAPGVKVSKIINLADDLALNLATSDIRIEAPIPGKSVVGIEVANDHKESVGFKEIIATEQFQHSEYKIPIALGKDISGNPIVAGIEKTPHLLIAGATGSGKSVCINTIIMSILYKANPNDVKLILIDPKVVELSVYNKIPHLCIPVVTDPKKASSALNWAVFEMERRYKVFSENFVRDITSYKEKAQQEDLEKLPYIVIVIDELSDLMMASANEVEDSICRLAQMARACGIHLIIATQRPTVDVITGTIKANIPSRIAFSVSSQIDSRTILDMSGAESLIGQGDMLFYPSGAMKPKRVQGSFISGKEVENVTKFLKSKNKSSYDEEIIEDIDSMQTQDVQGEVDDLYEDAIRIILQENSASISLLQRKLKIGYSRAGRIIDQLAENHIIGGHEGSKPRKILVSKDYFKEDTESEYSE